MFEERSGLVAVGELLRQWAAAREQLAKTERQLADLDPAGPRVSCRPWSI